MYLQIYLHPLLQIYLQNRINPRHFTINLTPNEYSANKFVVPRVNKFANTAN
jgi:hypothetical protein